MESQPLDRSDIYCAVRRVQDCPREGNHRKIPSIL